MRRLREGPAAEVIVGLLSFAISFFGVGLASAALDPKGGHSWLMWSAFSIGGLLMVLSLVALIHLSCSIVASNKRQEQVRTYLRQAYALRARVLTRVWNQEEAKSVQRWLKDVHDWLDVRLPDSSSDFGLYTINATHEALFYGGIDGEASRAALLLEHQATHLREILRDIRR